MINTQSFRYAVAGMLTACFFPVCGVSAQGLESASPGTVVLEDDFSSASPSWLTGKFQNGRTWIQGGAMHVRAVDGPGSIEVAYDAVYGDVIVEVEMELVDGTDDNWQTVTCRSADDDNYYDLGISADGYYLLDVWVDGSKLNKSLGPSRSTYIRTGRNVVNTLRVECVGDNLRLFVNGNQIAELTDQNHSRGRVGLSADAFDNSFSEILFDNVRITVP